MMDGLLVQVANVAVASEANCYGVGLGQAWLLAGVGAVAIGAISHSAGMLNLGSFDQLGFVVVAGDAEGFCIGLGEHDFAVFGWGMAHIASASLEGRVLEFRHQFGRG